MPAICPSCGGVLEPASRLCARCATPLDAEGTLEMLPHEPSEEALQLLSGRPIEFAPTVHRVRRWPFRVLDGLRWRRARVHRERAVEHLSRLLSDERR
jgi:hypothetical protein